MSTRTGTATLALVLSILLTGCGTVEPTVELSVPSATPLPSTATLPPPTASPDASPTSPTEISPQALAYLDEALDIMQQHSINREQIDWERLRARARSRAYGARTPEDTYIAVQYALRDLGDHHSHFMTPEQVAEFQDGTMNLASPDPGGQLLDQGLGYITIPGFVGMGSAANEHATEIQGIIREIDRDGPCGWVVDLRENTGGNMWPMLAGLGPILGEGRIGAFVYPDGKQVDWTYTGGEAWESDLLQAAVLGTPYELAAPSPPVAVLTGQRTSSSGEAVVVAFRGRPNTRSFGRVTMGLPTSNENFALSDGAWVFLTVSEFADRTGRQYSSVIPPDQVVGTENDEEDLALQAAVEWLLQQPACADRATAMAPPPTQAAEALPSPTWTPIAPSTYDGIRVTHVFNAGYLITAGDKRILIDALYQGYPEGILKPVVYAQPPFDGVDLILATHEHLDHFSPELVARYMRENPHTLFISTKSAVRQLLEEDKDLRQRTRGVDLKAGERKQIDVEGMELEAIFISHGVPDLLNLGFIITVDGVKLLHTGDLSPDHVRVSHLQEYGLPGEQIDVAFVPYFLLTMEEYHAHVTEGIQPTYLIPMHYPYEAPPAGIEDNFPNAFVFTDTLESWVLP